MIDHAPLESTAGTLGARRWVSAAAMATAVSVAYYVANLGTSGPAYLADEIGYLNNAAFFGGRFSDGASSYYAGYSMLLSPLFFFLSDPQLLWRGVTAINALMWGGVFLLLTSMVVRLFPGVHKGKMLLLVAVTAAYPSNVTMSGYAFSQSAVALFYMVAVYAMLMIEPSRYRSALPHALAVGFLCWIHPTGYAVLVASLTVLGVQAVRSGSYRAVLAAASVSITVALIYKGVVDPWRVAQMGGGDAASAGHYPAVGSVVASFLSFDPWIRVIGMIVGQMSYALIATFGFVLLGAARVFQLARSAFSSDGVGRIISGEPVVLAFAILSLVGCIALGAIGFTALNLSGKSHWIYGRYLDPVLLPLFAVGLFSTIRSKKWLILLTAVLVALAGAWIASSLPVNEGFNRVNVAGFWPAAIFPEATFGRWFLIGAVGLIVVGGAPKLMACVALLVFFATCVSWQLKWHRSVINYHSTPSEFLDFIRGNFDGGCIYFDDGFYPEDAKPHSVKRQRRELYSFYLYDYDYVRRSNSSEWRQVCDGPILTYDASVARVPGVTALAAERRTGLRLMAKGDVSRFRYPRRTDGQSMGSGWLVQYDAECFSSDVCFYASGADLSRHSQVGKLDARGLLTTGRGGYLLFGPYINLPKGSYELIVTGDARSASTVVVDVTSGSAETVHAKAGVEPIADKLVRLTFDLEQGVERVEIRVKVGPSDELLVKKYVLKGRTRGVDNSP